MKARLVQWTKPLLTACLALEVFLWFDISSIILFGEYEHPQSPLEE